VTTIALRPYQEEAIEKINDGLTRGVRRQLGVASTGLGKTIVFSSLAERMGVRTLILAHRDELISQAVDKMLAVWPDADIGVVKAERNETDHHVVVASVQTLARRSRLEQMPVDFGLVVTDEAHHSMADSYKRIYEYLNITSDSGPLHLGVTATPDRGDRKGLDSIFDEIIFSYDLLWGIRAGYLSDMRGLRVYLKDVDFTKAKVRRGDYDAGETGQMLEDADAPAVIADAWLKHAEGRKTIVFTPTVATAEHTAAELVARGVAAEVVSAQTPLEERRLMLKRFAADELDVIANCGVLTEGFDEPSVSCIVMARPTKSRALYTQCVGRGSRRFPNKQDCLVMDVCGVSDEHSLVTIPSLFGITKRDAFESGEKTVAEVVLEEEEERVKRGEIQARAVELFRRVVSSRINWITFSARFGRTAYAINLNTKDDKKGGSVVI
jgi:superfamily II DNA or RNA helicase